MPLRRSPDERLRTARRHRGERTTTIERGARDSQLRYDSAYEDLAVRDAELAAAMQLRAWTCDHDVLACVEHQTNRLGRIP